MKYDEELRQVASKMSHDMATLVRVKGKLGSGWRKVVGEIFER